MCKAMETFLIDIFLSLIKLWQLLIGVIFFQWRYVLCQIDMDWLTTYASSLISVEQAQLSEGNVN